MFNSVFQQYKDVVYVMPTKWLKTENSFDLVKSIIIGLVISIIRDNNAINKNLYLFCSLPNLQLYIFDFELFYLFLNLFFLLLNLLSSLSVEGCKTITGVQRADVVENDGK